MRLDANRYLNWKYGAIPLNEDARCRRRWSTMRSDDMMTWDDDFDGSRINGRRMAWTVLRSIEVREGRGETYDVVLGLEILFQVGDGRGPGQVAYPADLSCEDAGSYARMNSYRYHFTATVHRMVRHVDYSHEPFVSHVWQVGNAPQLEARTLLY